MDTPYASPKEQVSTWRWTSRLTLWLLIVFCFATCVSLAFVLGLLRGEEWIYRNQSRSLQNDLESVLKTLPGDYSSITMERDSNGGVEVSGDLSAQDLHELKQAIREQLGGKLVDDLTGGIDVVP